MDSEGFRNAINNGLGRAILWLREHSWTPYAAAIENVVLHNTAYDPQCEGSRAEYAYEIVSLTDNLQQFIDIAIKGLLEARNCWDTDHLFRLVRLFADAGRTEARDALYEKFIRDDAMEHFWGAGEIIRLDGEKGLLFVIDRIGCFMESNPDYWEDNSLLEEAKGIVKSDVNEIVRAAAAENPNIKRYLEAVAKHQVALGQRKFPDYHGFTYPQLREKIIAARGDVPRGWLFRWGKHACENDLREAAADLLKENDERVLLAYLRIFDRQSFDLNPQLLIRLAASEKGEITTAARRALRHIRDGTVRDFAVEMIQQGRADSDVAAILEPNYIAGDHKLLESLLDSRTDEDEFHWMAHSVLNVFRADDESDAGPSMLKIYERCRCSLCRMGAVKLLKSRKSAPSWMLEECRYDSNLELRKAVCG
jgi:hypothetical protein